MERPQVRVSRRTVRPETTNSIVPYYLIQLQCHIPQVYLSIMMMGITWASILDVGVEALPPQGSYF